MVLFAKLLEFSPLGFDSLSLEEWFELFKIKPFDPLEVVLYGVPAPHSTFFSLEVGSLEVGFGKTETFRCHVFAPFFGQLQ